MVKVLEDVSGPDLARSTGKRAAAPAGPKNVHLPTLNPGRGHGTEAPETEEME